MAHVVSIVTSDLVVYGSVLHPPSLPPHQLHLYNCLAVLTYLSLLLYACPAILAIYKEKYLYLLPWLVCNSVSVVLEILIFLFLLSKVREVGNGSICF